ncbi:hypothetical protein CC80DRAFT_496521 [Byssothecium circinans]|uniref:Uncharacterized protein n=1 Tax=Byssothecium circinans TaxID=147558 RepID=A0A6A5TPD7_9PLEO|nr:hypothetical protein CC80DRAFT_496521 [Byssothecium circinans]
MPSWPKTQVRPDLLLRLPRELRDEIYKEVLEQSGQIPLKGSYYNGLPPLFWKDPNLHVEALEIFYTVNRFFMSLEGNANTPLTDQWGPYPEAKANIRHLTVTCAESFFPKSATEFEETLWCSRERRRWEQLLELPHLTTLTIQMQKTHDTSLFTLDFGPILYQLRATHPDIKITFTVSFDTKLQIAWEDPRWTSPGRYHINTSPAIPYERMGYVDVSDLIAPPSDEDFKYVKDFLPKKSMPAAPQATLGLLSETVANRRVLGKAYVVKEPALLRVLMEGHHQIYLNYEKGGRKGG